MSFNANRLSHAYITDAVTADKIAKTAVCGARDAVKPCKRCVHCDKASRNIHPDIAIINKPDDKREILVDQIRELKRDVYLVPNEAERKVYLINEADLMNRNSQNAFLQILEEPPAHAIFLLVTKKPAALLPTVHSRCVSLLCEEPGERLEAKHTPVDETVNDFLTAVAGDNVLLMEVMFRLEKLDKQAFSDFLDSAREGIALSLRTDPSQKRLIYAEKVLVKAEEMLSLNVSLGHISGMICASMVDSN